MLKYLHDILEYPFWKTKTKKYSISRFSSTETLIFKKIESKMGLHGSTNSDYKKIPTFLSYDRKPTTFCLGLILLLTICPYYEYSNESFYCSIFYHLIINQKTYYPARACFIMALGQCSCPAGDVFIIAHTGSR